MSREIKFRAWDKKRKRMYEVLHLHLDSPEGIWATVKGHNIIEQKDIHIQIQPKDIELMQFTGLPDRDGSEIFRDDIIEGSYINKMSGELVKRFYLVVFENGCYIAKLIGKSPYGDTLLYFINEKCKVIGNIHENSELLEGESHG